MEWPTPGLWPGVVGLKSSTSYSTRLDPSSCTTSSLIPSPPLVWFSHNVDLKCLPSTTNTDCCCKIKNKNRTRAMFLSLVFPMIIVSSVFGEKWRWRSVVVGRGKIDDRYWNVSPSRLVFICQAPNCKLESKKGFKVWATTACDVFHSSSLGKYSLETSCELY